MKQTMKKFLSFFLALTLMISVLPATAFAAEETTNKPLLASLGVYSDFSFQQEIKVTPEFDKNTYNYELSVPDYQTAFHIKTELTDETMESNWAGKIYYKNRYVGATSNAFTNGKADLYNVVDNDGVLSLKLQLDETEVLTEYKINVNSYPTLKKLSMAGVVEETFNNETFTYHAKADGNEKGYDITPTAYSSEYTITVNDVAVENTKTYTVPYAWDKNDKMKVDIKLTNKKGISKTYTVNLEKMPQLDTPTIVAQTIEGAQYTVIDAEYSIKKMSVVASANGPLNYQWYYNSKNSTENATAIEGATAATYIPAITEDAIGKRYYFCKITNTGKTENNIAYTDIALVKVYGDPRPEKVVISPTGDDVPDDGIEYTWHKGYVYNIGDKDNVIPLQYDVIGPKENTTVTCEWKRVNAPYNNNGTFFYPYGKTVDGKFSPATYDYYVGGAYYTCLVKTIFNNKEYQSCAVTGETYTEKNEDGTDGETYDVQAIYVYIRPNASKPSITQQPVGANYIIGDTASPLSVNASTSDGGTLTYQWYKMDTSSAYEYEIIEGATNATYDIGETTTEGNTMYYCRVTNTLSTNNSTAYVNTTPITISVQALEKTVENMLEGNGTLDSPYLISNAQDYKDVAYLVANGFSFEGKYLRQAAENITLPEGWTPIGVTIDGTNDIKAGNNLRAFSGNLDGDNKTITIPEDGLPLLGYIKNATVKNLNIYGKKIAGYGLVNNLSGVNLVGSSIVIDNVTLKAGSSTLKSGLLGAEISTNSLAGCSARYVATIRNCIVEKDVIIGYSGEEDYIGSIAGRMQGTVENCISHAEVKGRNYVGGIIGTRDNAMGTCEVKNCSFEGNIAATGEHVGGIVGGGYENSTAPNGVRILINECTVNGSVIGKDKVGGILGGDSYVAQAWDEYSIKNNSFTGKVNATNGTDIGGIIGYYNSLNKIDDITNNYYKKDCGAQKGIGRVKYIDTSCKTHETESAAVYFNTELGIDVCPNVEGCQWKENYCRNDDPLGADATKLCYSDDNTEPIALELKVSGNYKTEYIVGDTLDAENMVVTVVYNDGSTKNISSDDITISGYDNTKVGEQKLTVAYGSLSTILTVVVRKPAGEINVTFSILGDKLHGDAAASGVHTLKDNNLETWIAATNYKVDSNATVLDVLNMVLKENGMSCSNPAGNYVESITKDGVTLAEFDNGVKSGWMYTLNGKHPTLAVNEQYLEDGDVIVFHYSDDYTVEEGSEEYNPADPNKPTIPGGDSTQQPTTPTTPSVQLAEPTSVTLAKTSMTYTGKALEPDVTVTDSKGAVIEPVYYDVTYTDNKEAGKATVTITFKDKYATAKPLTATFTITKAKASTIKVKDVVYTGKKISKSKLKLVTSEGVKLTSSEYKIKSIKNNKKIGKATIKVQFLGKNVQKKTRTLTFKIVPKSTNLKKLAKGKKQITLTWKAQKKQTTGYQIQYSTSKKFTKKTTKSVTAKISKTTATIKKLKAKMTYYVRIRTYKTVGKTKYYSAWSKVKSVKTK